MNAPDYRKFSFSKLNTDEFRHIKLLAFWPLFAVVFYTLERFSPYDYFYPIYCRLDDYIPFNEWFIIPYMFWFVFLIGMHIYTFFCEVPAFKKMMYFIIITYGVTAFIYAVFPNCQELRPVVFERDNSLIRFIRGFYVFDTNTNVCPSLHVVAAAWDTERFSGTVWKIGFMAVGLIISISTVFLKQHSIIDVIAGFALCIIAYIIVYKISPKRSAIKNDG